MQVSGPKIGFDIAAYPGVEQAAAIARASGATWCAAYIGGPESAGVGWDLGALQRLVPVVPDGFVPIFVGQNFSDPLNAAIGIQHAQQAVAIVRGMAFPAGSCIFLDVEASTYENRPNPTIRYINAWSTIVRNLGYRPGIYSSAACLSVTDYDFSWCANWDEVGQPEGHDIHQFSSTTEAGSGVDLNAARPDFPFAKMGG